MGLLFLAAAITAIIIKANTWLSRFFYLGILVGGFLVLPGQSFIVAPVVVVIGLFFKEKIDDIRGS